MAKNVNPKDRCPRCGQGTLVTDATTAENFCGKCGFVITDKVDEYLDYVTESWMEENKLAVESGLRTEIAEGFIESLKTVFEEHYIDIPEEKFDVLVSNALGKK